MVASEDRFIMVQGRAGSGKSTMLQPVAKLEALHAAGHLLQSAGCTPLLLTVDMKSNAKALAFQNKMVADLRVDTGMNAMTVDGFIYQNERYLQGKASPEAFASQREALKGTYIFVDEMSMLSDRKSVVQGKRGSVRV